MFKIKSVFLGAAVFLLSVMSISAHATLTDSGHNVTFPNNSGSANAIVAGGSNLTTVFAANNGFAGNTFDVTVIGSSAITITGFDVNLEAVGTTETISLYTRVGTSVGHENTPADWTLAGADPAVISSGADNPSHVDIGGIVLQPGVTYGFYIDFTSYIDSVMGYTNGGPTVFSDSNLQITTNTGQANPAFTGSFFPRVVNTTLYYTDQTALAAQNIPTTSTTMLIILALMLSLVGLGMIRKNKHFQ